MAERPRVLLVEDEENLAKGIAFNLDLDGYEVVTEADGGRALERLARPGGAEDRYDLVVLDVMLPGRDGLAVARAARTAGNFTPILMLTARGLPSDMVHGLEAGADDYLAKPFDLPVLLARIRSLLRRREWARAGDNGTTAVRIGAAEVDFDKLEVRLGDRLGKLTVLEAMLLRLLVSSAGRVVGKGEILEKVWNLRPDTQTRAVDNFVMRLRRHLEPDPRAPRHLLTVRGAGYRLVLDA
jgi:DNA-binding response OmpR family regulator